jgi:hypothetical protein
MHATRDTAELDLCGDRPCGRCPTHSRFLHLAVAVGLCVLLFLALDQLGKALKPGRMSPFSVTPAQSDRHARILFARNPVIDLKAPSTGVRELEAQLNAAYNDMRKPRFDIETSSAGSALIRLNGAGLLEVTAAESGPEPPKALAEKWSHRLRELVDGKGSAGESCPECHIARRSEVLAWMARPMRR